MKEVELVHGLLQEFLADVTYKEWEGQITEAVYEAEDIIGSLKARISAEKGQYLFRLPLVELIISFEKHRLKPLLAILPESKILEGSTEFDIADIHHMTAALMRDIRRKVTILIIFLTIYRLDIYCTLMLVISHFYFIVHFYHFSISADEASEEYSWFRRSSWRANSISKP